MMHDGVGRWLLITVELRHIHKPQHLWLVWGEYTYGLMDSLIQHRIDSIRIDIDVSGFTHSLNKKVQV